MNWKIIILLFGLSVLVIPVKNDSMQDQVNGADELYDGKFVELLNSMETLDKNELHFSRNDIQQLSKVCGADEKCLDIKKASVVKYHQKIQGIQCVNGLFVMKICNKLSAKVSLYRTMHVIVNSNLVTEIIVGINKIVHKYIFFVIYMLSVLHEARMNPYRWQIEVFTFLATIKSEKLKIVDYAAKFDFTALKCNLNTFVDQCVRNNYLNANADKEISYKTMNNMYKAPVINYADGIANRYTVPNLMLMHLYKHHEFICDWSMLGINLGVESRLAELVELYTTMYKNHQWQLKPMDGYEYHALISNCIHSRLLYHIYVHISVHHSVQSQLPNDGVSQTDKKQQLLRSWSALVDPLKVALRAFRIADKTYWSLVRDMMDDTNSTTIDKLAKWENNAKRTFLDRVKETGGPESADKAEEKLNKLPVSKNYEINIESIRSNAKRLVMYTNRVLEVLKPVDGGFINLLMLAEKNPFYSR